MTQKEYYQEYKRSVSGKLGINETVYRQFKRYGEKLQMIYEKKCNGFDTEEGEKRAERNEELYTTAAKKESIRRGLFIFFQSDPRGATIYLSTEPIPENNYTIACCIY